MRMLNNTRRPVVSDRKGGEGSEQILLFLQPCQTQKEP